MNVMISITTCFDGCASGDGTMALTDEGVDVDESGVFVLLAIAACFFSVDSA